MNETISSYIPNIGSNAKNKQKKIIISDDAAATAIENRLKDIASLRDCSTSRLYEEAVVAQYFPSNARALAYAVRLYNGVEYRNGKPNGKADVRTLCREIAQQEAAGTGWRSRHSDNLPFVSFLRDILMTKDSSSRPELYEEGFDGDNPRVIRDGEWDALCEILADHAAEGGFETERDKREAQKALEFAQGIAAAMKSGWTYMHWNSVAVIAQQWDILGDSTHAYRYIAAMLETIHPWEDAAVDRLMFVKMMEKQASLWDAEEEKGTTMNHGTIDYRIKPIESTAERLKASADEKGETT